MGIFVFSSCYADSFRRHDVTSTFELFSSLCIALVPYAAGKLLIESNGMRVAVIKRIVFCQFIAFVDFCIRVSYGTKSLYARVRQIFS